MSDHVPNDFLQPMQVTKGYFVQAEKLKDFIDYLFDIEQVDDYEEVWERFEKHEEQQALNKNTENNV